MKPGRAQSEEGIIKRQCDLGSKLPASCDRAGERVFWYCSKLEDRQLAGYPLLDEREGDERWVQVAAEVVVQSSSECGFHRLVLSGVRLML